MSPPYLSVRSNAFLKEADLQPNRSLCWLNPHIEDFDRFQDQVGSVNDVYLSSSQMEEEGTHVFSTDEKTGIQAREHKNPKQVMSKGKPECIDPEYIRHGTTGLIASRNVATGEIVAPLIQPSRKEEDFAKHIEDVIRTDPDARFCFIMDNLNTHKSEALVRLVAGLEGTDEEELGEKERRGILKSMASREEYLTDRSHQVYIVYTPKHCSWLNQIECWFSILTRWLLNKRSSFISIEELETKIRDFIVYYNSHMKKAFQWTFNGKLLRV